MEEAEGRWGGGAGDKEKEGKEGKASARERGVQEGNIIAVHR